MKDHLMAYVDQVKLMDDENGKKKIVLIQYKLLQFLSNTSTKLS